MLAKSLCIINRLNSGLVTKTKYDSDKQGLQKKIEDFDKKIPSTSGLVKKTDYNTLIENNIPIVIGLVTTTIFNTKASGI